MRDPLTELDAALKGEPFTFDPSALAAAVNQLRPLESRARDIEFREDDADDLAIAIAACEALYRHLHRLAADAYKGETA